MIHCNVYFKRFTKTPSTHKRNNATVQYCKCCVLVLLRRFSCQFPKKLGKFDLIKTLSIHSNNFVLIIDLSACFLTFVISSPHRLKIKILLRPRGLVGWSVGLGSVSSRTTQIRALTYSIRFISIPFTFSFKYLLLCH